MAASPRGRTRCAATAAALACAAAVLSGPAPRAVESAPPDERTPFRLAFVGPLSGALEASGKESLLGVRYAVEWRASQGGVAGRPVEVTAYDDRDEPAGAEKALAAAEKARADAIVAAPTGRTVEALVARGRRGKTPLFLAGTAAPKPSIDPKDPLAFVGAWPVDHALALASSLAIPCNSVAPGIVAEDTPRGREIEAALRRNLGPRQRAAGTAFAPPHGGPTAPDLARLRDAKCDRLVLVGEPDLLDRTLEVLAEAGWSVPLLLGEGMASGAAKALFDPARQDALKGAFLVVGSPQLTVDGPPSSLYRAHEQAAGSGAPVWPRTVEGFTAADLLLQGAAKAVAATGPKPPRGLLRGSEIAAAARDVRYGPEEAEMPVFDLAGYAALYRWRIWKPAPNGPEPFDVTALPAEGFGPLLRLRDPARYVAEPGTKVVWVTFSDATGKKPRTIDGDLADLGLSTRGYEANMDAWVLDDLMARALGKLNRLFLRNEDGTPIPGVSFGISFTAKKPESLEPSEYWTALVAGDDPDAGGRAWPGDGYCEVYATFLKRTIFLPHALEPRIGTEDKTLVDGTYPWRLEPAEHKRVDAIRCLLDGYAGSFALTGAHEIGHLAGLGHDVTDPRSLMNVAEGVGLRETQTFFIPAHAAILERLLGRAPDKAPDRKR